MGVRGSQTADLDRLDLTDDDIGGESLRGVAVLKKLRVLVLRGTRVTDKGLLHLNGLRSLQHLDLTDCAISDTGVIHLRKMASLQEVVIWGNQSVTADAVARLQSFRPDLTIDWGGPVEGEAE